jgi:hypothetical protein
MGDWHPNGHLMYYHPNTPGGGGGVAVRGVSVLHSLHGNVDDAKHKMNSGRRMINMRLIPERRQLYK